MVKINEEGCVGCGMCESMCPDGFEMVDMVAKVKDKNADCIEKAARACPRQVIMLDDGDGTPQQAHPGFGQGRGMGSGRGMGQGRGQGMGRGQGGGMGRRRG